jgi:hypothetical protein
MRRRKRKVTLTLPDEFLDLCEFDSAEPERVLRGFIADVSNIWSDRPRADGYNSNGSDQSSLALDYYLSVDHRRLYRFMREHEEVKNQLKSPGSQAADLNCRARQKDLTADTFATSLESRRFGRFLIISLLALDLFAHLD